MSYYLGPVTKAGLAVIYACFSYRSKQYRVSTGLKVQVNHWNSRCHYAIVGEGMSPLDIYNNRIINSRLREIDIAFLEKIEYFCTNFQDITSMPEVLLKAIKPDYKMSRKKKENNPQQKSATELMIAYRLNNQANERSFGTSRTNILDFRKFLSESKIPDTIECMTKDIAARYAEWLKKQHISINTANQRIRALATNLKNLTTILDLNFDYPLPAKLPLLKETITGDEMEDNDIALTEAQVNTLYELKGLTPEEEVARDMFCLQCWTGVRVSDVAKVLSSANLKEVSGEIFTIFRPEKTKNSKSIRAIIPLTTLFPEVFGIVNKYLDNPPKFLSSRKNNYNELIRAICRQAKFDDLRSVTIEQGKGKKTRQVKLWELMTSHKGRHTFTTNCKRRGIPENEIIKMTGHASTVQIKKTYDNTSAEDNAQLLLKSLGGTNQAVSVVAAPTIADEPVSLARTGIKSVHEIVRSNSEILKEAYEMHCGPLSEHYRQMLSQRDSYRAEAKDDDDDLLELMDAILSVTFPYLNLSLTNYFIGFEQTLNISKPDPDFNSRWSMLEIFETLRSIPIKYASAIVGRQDLSGKQFDAAILAIQQGYAEKFIGCCGDLDTRNLTWLCQVAIEFLGVNKPTESYGKSLLCNAVNTARYLNPSMEMTALTDINKGVDELLDILTDIENQDNDVTDRLLKVYLFYGGCLLSDAENEQYPVVRQYLKEILKRDEARPLLAVDSRISAKKQYRQIRFESLSYFGQDVLIDKDVNEFITPLNSKFIAGGDEKLMQLVDYLAQHNIENSDDVKKMLAYRITGRNRPPELVPIRWMTRGNRDNGYDLCYLLQHIALRGGQKLIDQMNRFFYGPSFPQAIAQYAKSANYDFRTELHSIMPEVFP